MPVMKLHSAIRDYDVHFEVGSGFLNKLIQNSTCIIVDKNVQELYGKTLLSAVADPIVIDCVEDNKNLDAVQELIKEFVRRGVKRKSRILSIGGGIMQDISGFAVSTYFRGVGWTFVPTTTLAQADSCIGGKTSLNFGKFKNLIGTFYPPSDIYIHPDFLKTLKDYDYQAGVGEIIKLHLLGGADRFSELKGLMPGIQARSTHELSQAIKNSLYIKNDFISQDEFDLGVRNHLNFGHCFGHALEATSNFAVPHGTAVLVGIIFANIIARKRGVLVLRTESDLAGFIRENIVGIKLNKQYFDPPAVIEAMSKDKKRTGVGYALIMMMDDFKFTKVDDLTEEEITLTLNDLMRELI